jgi:hypothetical protein
MSSRAVFAAFVVAAAALLGSYAAAGGGTYKPLVPQDPCRERPLEALRGGGHLLEQLALSALDGAACALRVPREELALALATPRSRERFGRRHHIGEEELERAIRGGLDRAVADAERSRRLSGLEETLLRAAAERLPEGLLVELLRSGPGRELTDLLEDLIARQIP